MWRWLQSLPRALRQQWHGPGASAGVCVDEINESEANFRKDQQCRHENNGWQSHCRYSGGEEEEKKGPHPDKYNFWQCVYGPCSTFEAFGWGGALAVGIHVSRYVHQREEFRGPDTWRRYCLLQQVAYALPTLEKACTGDAANPTDPAVDGDVQRGSTSTRPYRNESSVATWLQNDVQSVRTAVRQNDGRKTRVRAGRIQADTKQENAEPEIETLEEAFAGFEDICRKYTAVGKGIMGSQAASAGQMKKAIAFWKESSDLGHSKSQYNLGMCFETGDGVKKNIRKAVHYYQLATEDNHPQAMYNLALIYLEGSGDGGQGRAVCGADRSTALQLLSRAADLGLVQAQQYLGMFYLESGGRDIPSAINYLTKAAEQNDAESLYLLGNCYQQGYGVEKDGNQSADLYRKAAEQGHTDAMVSLAQFHLHGNGGVSRDVSYARQLLERARELGSTEAGDLLQRLRKSIVAVGTAASVPGEDGQHPSERISYLLRLNSYVSSPCLSDLVRNDISQHATDTDIVYDPVSPLGTLSQLYTQLFVPRGSTVAPSLTKIVDKTRTGSSRRSSQTDSDSDSGVVFKLGQDFDEIETDVANLTVGRFDDLTHTGVVRSKCLPRTATMPELQMVSCA